MWEPSFLAVQVLLGDSIEDAVASLAQERRDGIADVVMQLRSSQRSARARVLASVVQDIAFAVRAETGAR